jgi:anti-sigma regulatory factor (Ser/Thr protein kinase)
MTAPTASTDAMPAASTFEMAAQLQRGALAAVTAPGTQARLAAGGCYWRTGTWRIFPGTPDQVAKVRRYIRSELIGHPALDDAMLAASELATNAMAHSASGHQGGMFAVHLTLASPHHIAVLVTDQGGPNQPQISRPGTGQESGRGLHVVASLASQLLTTGDTNGRSVLAVIPSPPDETETLATRRTAGHTWNSRHPASQ